MATTVAYSCFQTSPLPVVRRMIMITCAQTQSSICVYGGSLNTVPKICMTCESRQQTALTRNESRWWGLGLKDEIRSTCLLYPLTHYECTDIEKVHSDACAYGLISHPGYCSLTAIVVACSLAALLPLCPGRVHKRLRCSDIRASRDTNMAKRSEDTPKQDICEGRQVTCLVCLQTTWPPCCPCRPFEVKTPPALCHTTHDTFTCMHLR